MSPSYEAQCSAYPAANLVTLRMHGGRSLSYLLRPMGRAEAAKLVNKPAENHINLVRDLVVWPDAAELKARFDRYPVHVTALIQEALRIDGLSQSAEVDETETGYAAEFKFQRGNEKIVKLVKFRAPTAAEWFRMEGDEDGAGRYAAWELLCRCCLGPEGEPLIEEFPGAVASLRAMLRTVAGGPVEQHLGKFSPSCLLPTATG